MTPIDQFMMDCHRVAYGRVAEIKNLRALSKTTGLSLKDMRLVAEVTDVEIVKDGKELKAVKYCFT